MIDQEKDRHGINIKNCSALQHPAAPCSTLQHPAAPYSTLQHTHKMKDRNNTLKGTTCLETEGLFAADLAVFHITDNSVLRATF